MGDDGALPETIILAGNILYGKTASGTVFKVNIDGSGFTNICSIAGVGDGGEPHGGLILSSNKLYGTTGSGGTMGSGTVFKLNVDGSDFTNLYNFTGIYYPSYRNNDGGDPVALILSDNVLYGAANVGGTNGCGTVFKINTDGSGFVTLHNFNGSDGYNPNAGLILSGNTLYGQHLEETAFLVMERCLRSILMEAILPTFIISLAGAMGLIQWQV